MAKYIDTHCHLYDQAYEGKEREIINNFSADNIEFVINCSSDRQSSLDSINLAKEFSSIYCAVGCHPHDAKTFDEQFEKLLISAAALPKTVAIGEIGLDYYYDLSDREAQKAVFEKQLRIADSVGKPVVLHIRDAWGDTIEILNKNKQYINNGLLLHCYGGSKEITEELSKKYDAYFAFGGSITFKNFAHFDSIKAVPKNRLLTETDSPYLAPTPLRGTVNQPKNVALCAAKLAEVLDMDIEDLCKTVRENTLRFFRITDR